jgi:hypothetical protein
MPVCSFHIIMQYMIRNNVHLSFLHKFGSRQLATPYIVTELPIHISVTQFVSATQNTLQGPWLVNNVIVNEVHRVHDVTITFTH